VTLPREVVFIRTTPTATKSPGVLETKPTVLKIYWRSGQSDG
jgi:hypothetical protein